MPVHFEKFTSISKLCYRKAHRAVTFAMKQLLTDAWGLLCEYCQLSGPAQPASSVTVLGEHGIATSKRSNLQQVTRLSNKAGVNPYLTLSLGAGIRQRKRWSGHQLFCFEAHAAQPRMVTVSSQVALCFSFCPTEAT